jgi:hypothetical protein
MRWSKCLNAAFAPSAARAFLVVAVADGRRNGAPARKRQSHHERADL